MKYRIEPICVLILFYSSQWVNTDAFSQWKTTQSNTHDIRNYRSLTMQWMFGKGSGSMKEVGGQGSQGELYFIPSKTPSLKAPPKAIGKEGILPIFPRNQVLGPLGEEYLGIYEMRYRQLLYDIGDGGIFGHSFYSQDNSKLALVGTLARAKRMERLDDGGIYVVMEGIGRYFVKSVISEKPYLRARVQIFTDYVEDNEKLLGLEQNILDEVRYSVKIMKLLYPNNNYTLNELVVKNRPIVPSLVKRNVELESMERSLRRRSQFSFAVMDMLKTDPVTKLCFLQEPVIERRNARILKVLQDSTSYLESEVLKRGVMREERLKDLRKEIMEENLDLIAFPLSSWVPTSDVSGEWKMNASIMD